MGINVIGKKKNDLIDTSRKKGNNTSNSDEGERSQTEVHDQEPSSNASSWHSSDDTVAVTVTLVLIFPGEGKRGVITAVAFDFFLFDSCFNYSFSRPASLSLSCVSIHTHYSCLYYIYMCVCMYACIVHIRLYLCR